MIMRLSSYILILLLILNADAVGQEEIEIKSYFIGDTELSVYRECYKPCSNQNVLFINVHDNEKTSVNAAVDYLKQNGGSIAYIFNNGQRNVPIKIKDSTYIFDPNRIYSREGRIATLTSNSTSFDSAAEVEVANFASAFLKNYIDKRKLVIAFHNNTDSNFSILNYQHDIDSLPNTGQYFINPAMDVDDFILTDNREIFDSLKSRNINAVWEVARNIPDDGSLSVYAGLNNIPYINIEAQHEHLEEQQMMLGTIDDIIKKYQKGKKQRKGKIK